VSTLGKTFHDQLEQVNQKLLDEILVFKDSLEEKVKEISVIKADLDNADAELNKERNIYISLNNEFQSMIENHEKEITLRLQFESKLNNQTSIFKELESRFKTLAKEFIVNNDRQDELFTLLAQYRNDNSNISARNNQLELENKIVAEKYNMNEKVVLQMSDTKKKHEAELKKLNDELIELRSERNITISVNKDLENALSYKNDEFTAKKSENQTLDLKIDQKDGIIRRQNEMIETLQSELRNLRKDIE